MIRNSVLPGFHPDLKKLPSAKGIWAPCLTYCEADDLFYVVYGVMNSMNARYFDVEKKHSFSGRKTEKLTVLSVPVLIQQNVPMNILLTESSPEHLSDLHAVTASCTSIRLILISLITKQMKLRM